MISLLSFRLAMFFALSCLIACSVPEKTLQVQESLPSANAAPANSGDGKELSVEGKTNKLVSIQGDLRDSLLSQPMPEVWLSDIATGERVSLAPESQILLKEYWVDKLANLYCTEIERGGAQKQFDCDTRLSRSANRVWRKLESQLITVNGSDRPIYYEEAGNLIQFLGIAAFDLVTEVKQRPHWNG